MNKAIEKELVNFKQEIEEKFAKSKVNREYYFPWKPIIRDSDERQVLDQEDPVMNMDQALFVKKVLKTRKDLNIYTEQVETEITSFNNPLNYVLKP